MGDHQEVVTGQQGCAQNWLAAGAEADDLCCSKRIGDLPASLMKELSGDVATPVDTQ